MICYLLLKRLMAQPLRIMSINSPENSWHITRWPPLAWMETVFKLVAIGIGTAAIIEALDEGDFQLSTDIALVQFILMGILSTGLIAAVFDRLKEKEIISMEFVIFNNIGHWSLFMALAASPGPGWKLIAFCALFLAGDLVKMLFIKVHSFQVRDTPRSIHYGLTAFYATSYAVLIALEIVK